MAVKPGLDGIKTLADFQRYNFFRRPEWRWERVESLCTQGLTPMRCSRHDDDYIKHARNFWLRWRAAHANDDVDMQRRLMVEMAGPYTAYQYQQSIVDNPDSALYLQSRILARQSREDIAKAMGLHPGAVEWYEALFFNVLDHIDHRDWITKHVIVPAVMHRDQILPAALPSQHSYQPELDGPDDEAPPVFRDSTVALPFLDGTLKMFAYFGGPFVADVMINGFQSGRPVNNADDLPEWLNEQFALTIRKRSAQAVRLVELNKYNVMELLAVHTRIIELDRSVDMTAAGKNEHERNVRAMLDTLPWCVGDKGALAYAKRPSGRYDQKAAELRDSELIQLEAGDGVTIEDYPKALPAAPNRKQKLETAKVELV